MELLNSTKGQTWYVDFVIGLTIMTVAFIIFINSTADIIGVQQNEFTSVISDAGRISGMLLTAGYPYDWDNDSVDLVGLAENNRINSTKLFRYSLIPYDESRLYLGTRHDYFVFFQDEQGSVINLGGFCGLGKNQSSVLSAQYCSNFSLSAEHLAKEERLVIYNSTITRMVTYVWE